MLTAPASLITLSIDSLPVAAGDATIPSDTYRALPLGTLLSLDPETARVLTDLAYSLAADIRAERVRRGLTAWA